MVGYTSTHYHARRNWRGQGVDASPLNPLIPLFGLAALAICGAPAWAVIAAGAVYGAWRNRHNHGSDQFRALGAKLTLSGNIWKMTRGAALWGLGGFILTKIAAHEAVRPLVEAARPLVDGAAGQVRSLLNPAG